MGAYHFVLPSHMQWKSGMIDVPGMITWGLFAINFDLSTMLVLIGVLACVHSVSASPRTAAGRCSLCLPAGFWLVHQMYLRTHTMPIPDSLWLLRLALESFGILVLVAHIFGAIVIMKERAAACPVRTRRIVIAGTALGAALMGIVVGAVLLSMGTLKPQEGSGNVATSLGVPVDAADRFNLPTMSELTAGVEQRTFGQETRISDETYLRVWPHLKDVMSEEAAFDATSQDAGLLNLCAQQARERTDFETADTAIARAIELAPEHHLHHLQAAFIGLSKMHESASPMARWALSTKTQRAFQNALDLDPSIHSARLYVAYALEQTPAGFGGNPRAAMQLLNDAVDAGDDMFLPVRALFLLQRGDTEQGLADALRSMRAGWYDDRTFVLASKAARESDDPEAAIDFATFAIRADSSNIDAWNALALALGDTGDRARASAVEAFVASIASSTPGK